MFFSDFFCINVIQIQVSINIFNLKRFVENNLKFIALQKKTDEDRWGLRLALGEESSWWVFGLDWLRGREAGDNGGRK